MDTAMKYEKIVRHAFEFCFNKPIDDGKDPGEMAVAGYFTEDNICTVKSGVSYAIGAINVVINKT